MLAVEVLRYPLTGWGNHSIIRTPLPGLYIKETTGLHGLDADETWHCSLESNFHIVSEFPWFAQLQILENRIFDLWAVGWKEIGYDDGAWLNAKTYPKEKIKPTVSPGNLHPRPIPSMLKIPKKFHGLYGNMQSDTSVNNWNQMLQGKGSVQIAPHSHEYVEIDAGELTCGFLSLRMSEGMGTVIRLLTSEGYVTELPSAPGASPKKGDRTDWKTGKLYGFTDTYQPAGTGTENIPERYEPFRFRTFHFIKLEILTGDSPLTLLGFDYLETGYPLNAVSHVETSDKTLAAIWDISLRSQRRCMQETYIDCPFYEQLQYAMDSRSQILHTYAISGDDRLARQCMDDFRRSQRPDGMFNCCYPDTEPNVIPDFSIYYILMLYDHMMYVGDKNFLRQHLGCMDGILNFFEQHLDNRGLVGSVGGLLTDGGYWSYIDWAPQWGKTIGTPPAGLTSPITMESLLYIMGLSHAAEISDYLGRPDTAQEYRQRAAKVRSAVNMYCKDSKGYQDGPGVSQYSQHCQVFAILTDTIPAEEGRKFLLASLQDTVIYASCTVAMAFYLFRALEKAGIYEETQSIWNLWKRMLDNHLTTCVENFLDERSDCHAWGSLALYELTSVTLGVRPAAPGYQKISIQPVPGYLDYAKGDVITPHGMVHVEWHKNDDGTIAQDYQVPDHVEIKTK